MSTNIALLGPTGPQRVTDSVVVYDAVYGGLRLTEALFNEFAAYADQLRAAASMAGHDALIPSDVAERLATWAGSLAEIGGDAIASIQLPEGWMQIYKPGSELAIYHHNNLVGVTVGTPQLIDLPISDAPVLVYANDRKGGVHMVMHAQLQPVGQDWQWAFWNKDTGEIRDLDDVEPGAAASGPGTAAPATTILRPPRRARVAP